MNTCKKCGGPAPDGHEICWICEHEPKLGIQDKTEEHKCFNDACPIEFETSPHAGT